jgi:hypothetical protein
MHEVIENALLPHAALELQRIFVGHDEHGKLTPYGPYDRNQSEPPPIALADPKEERYRKPGRDTLNEFHRFTDHLNPRATPPAYHAKGLHVIAATAADEYFQKIAIARLRRGIDGRIVLPFSTSHVRSHLPSPPSCTAIPVPKALDRTTGGNNSRRFCDLGIEYGSWLARHERRL